MTKKERKLREVEGNVYVSLRAVGMGVIVTTGWRRINRTIQPFNRVYEKLDKIAPLTLVAHRQIRRQKM